MNHLPILLELELQHLEHTRQREADAFRRGSFPHAADDNPLEPAQRKGLAYRFAAHLAQLHVSLPRAAAAFAVRYR